MGDPADTHSSESTAVRREPHPILQRALAWRERIRSNTATRLAWKVVTGLVGTAVLLAGLVMVPLPGPGWLVVILGLAILSTEFVWAQRVLHFVRAQVHAWTRWVGRRSLPVRGLIGLVGIVFVSCVVWGTFAVFGVPGWVPDQFVPPLPGL